MLTLSLRNQNQRDKSLVLSINEKAGTAVTEEPVLT